MKKEKEKLRLKVTPKDTKKSRGIRFSESEEQIIQSNADRYTDGDFSEWVRQAAIRYIPHPKDLEKVS